MNVSLTLKKKYTVSVDNSVGLAVLLINQFVVGVL